MGSFFTNVNFLRTNNSTATVSSAMAKLGYRPSQDGIELLLLPNNGRWCTVHSESMDFELLHSALAECAESVLTIDCCDSDFILLTLTRAGRTETVCVGEPYDGDEIEIKLTPEHWQPVVGSLDAFRSILDGDYVFAEDSLGELDKLFGFDAAQINVTPEELLYNLPADMVSLRYENTNPSEFEQLRSTLMNSLLQTDIGNKTIPAEFSDALNKLTHILFSDADS